MGIYQLADVGLGGLRVTRSMPGTSQAICLKDLGREGLIEIRLVQYIQVKKKNHSLNERRSQGLCKVIIGAGA